MPQPQMTEQKQANKSKEVITKPHYSEQEKHEIDIKLQQIHVCIPEREAKEEIFEQPRMYKELNNTSSVLDHPNNTAFPPPLLSTFFLLLLFPF